MGGCEDGLGLRSVMIVVETTVVVFMWCWYEGD